MTRCPKCSGPMHQLRPDESCCWYCGKRVYEDLPKPAEVDKGEKVLNGAWQYKQCGVEGCTNTMRINTGRPYCSHCATKLRIWKQGPGTGPAPIIEVNGRWMKNPEWKGRNNPRPGVGISVAA
jgi:hypothetical protein